MLMGNEQLLLYPRGSSTVVTVHASACSPSSTAHCQWGGYRQADTTFTTAPPHNEPLNTSPHTATPSSFSRLATAPAMRQPTWLQKLSCACYVYFIPVLLAVNLLCLFNKYTAFIWLL